LEDAREREGMPKPDPIEREPTRGSDAARLRDAMERAAIQRGSPDPTRRRMALLGATRGTDQGGPASADTRRGALQEQEGDPSGELRGGVMDRHAKAETWRCTWSRDGTRERSERTAPPFGGWQSERVLQVRVHGASRFRCKGGARRAGPDDGVLSMAAERSEPASSVH
jgi:hypothetical protein